jgi:2-oxo-4-hydroxy-4-carboxy-5-ureidoimidazoline decarboxylase
VTSSALPGLARFNAADAATAATTLHAVCASTAWGAAVAAGRPYAGVEALCAAGDAATAALTEAGLDEALAGHPPIGRPEPGTSSREQAGMAGAPDALKAEMLELNLAYQERFGHVFLICATGLSGEQMLEAVKERLGNTPEREHAVVREQLGRINRIRLARMAAEGE